MLGEYRDSFLYAERGVLAMAIFRIEKTADDTTMSFKAIKKRKSSHLDFRFFCYTIILLYHTLTENCKNNFISFFRPEIPAGVPKSKGGRLLQR